MITLKYKIKLGLLRDKSENLPFVDYLPFVVKIPVGGGNPPSSGNRKFCSGIFSLCGGKMRRSDFDFLNLFQS